METAAVDAGVYAKMAHFYDVTFGPALQAGRRRAVQRIALQPGERLLEVGVGTGINLPLYPGHWDVTGIDLSAAMLAKARQRRRTLPRDAAQLLQMDADRLAFDDNAFDVVYAAYTVSAVPNPARVLSEMRRVCRTGGRVVLLSHFRSETPWIARLERLLSPFAKRIGFTMDLDLGALVAGERLRPLSIERVNFPPMWSLVTCVKD
jgi:phosphatidylethanolamine/phosphatidyl-N-methylethanolamine N-methyltransferase